MNPGSNKANSVLIFSPDIVFVKLLAMGSHVHEKYGRVQGAFTVLLGNHRLLVGIHAAHTRAITVIPLVDIPGPHALEPSDFFGFCLIRGAHQMSLMGAGCREQAFKLNAGDNVGGGTIPIGLVGCGIKRGKPRG